jgi:hypothetical protein
MLVERLNSRHLDDASKEEVNKTIRNMHAKKNYNY